MTLPISVRAKIVPGISADDLGGCTVIRVLCDLRRFYGDSNRDLVQVLYRYRTQVVRFTPDVVRYRNRHRNQQKRYRWYDILQKITYN
jgi:hypothetical protein